MDSYSIETGSRILASTLHEIRTPIQTIISTSELLSDTSLDKEQLEYLHQIEFSANVLLQLANEILDFTKIRSKEFKLENIPFNPAELTENVIDLITIDAFNRGLEIITSIDYSIPVQVMGDPTRVQQVLLNLVKNAVKFTPKGYIQVNASADAKYLLFEVTDSGIGIPDEKKDLIFKDYYQVDASTTRKYGGTGLGLSICQNLVKVMNGKIGIKDNPGGGTIFYFKIPYTLPENSCDEKNTLTIPENTRILVVDDNLRAMESLKLKLNALGVKDILTAQSGSEALKVLTDSAAEGKPVTVTFIDMIMPVMDGWRLAAKINEDKRINNLLLYLVVPEGQMGGEAKMKLLEWFNGYLYKPVKRHNLFETLHTAFTQPFNLEALETTNQPFTSDALEMITQREEKKSGGKQEQILPDVTKQNDALIAENYRILIAEDHPLNRKIMNTFLERFGATVYIAEDGEQAVQRVNEHPEIDLIFMDIQMPVKNGVDATVELRHKNFKGIIIACTANNDPNDLKQYVEFGINDVLVKPFKRDSIKQLLEKWKTVLSIPAGKQKATLDAISKTTDSVWNFKEFLEAYDNNSDYAKSLITEYITQTRQILIEIKTELSYPQIDFEELTNLSHRLKGSSGMVYAPLLAKYAGEMETAAKNHDKIQIESNRFNFNLDFLKLEQLEQNWEQTL